MEIQKKVCKKCGKLKERRFMGYFNKKDKKWTDEFGAAWNGLVCSECNRIRVKDIMKRSRNVQI